MRYAMLAFKVAETASEFLGLQVDSASLFNEFPSPGT